MASKVTRHNFRVEVFPRSAGDFGFVSIGGVSNTEAEDERACEGIARDIRRHVDGLPSRGRGVNVTWDSEKVCAHCGYAWTEKSDTYNGGCCTKDEEGNPEAEAA